MYVAFVYVESAQMEYPLDIRIRTLIAAIEDWRPGEIEREREEKRERERQREEWEREQSLSPLRRRPVIFIDKEKKGAGGKVESKILRRSSCPESSMRPELIIIFASRYPPATSE